MEVGLMEIVRSINRSWIYDSYFSLYRPIHPGLNVRGELSESHPASIQFPFHCFHQKTYRQEHIAEHFNANTIAITGSPRVCGDPVLTRSPLHGPVMRST